MASLGVIDVLIRTKDETAKGINSAEKSAKKFGDKLSAWTIAKGQMIGNFAESAIRKTADMTKTVVKSAISSFADYEQLVGGVETLFKGNASDIMRYAKNAYKTAGVSANQYMELTTSFAASLLQSVGEDTKIAADLADRAVTDMADNANKMGTDLASIQNAYKGFSKQNYTMLDNLKLGYGGTKTEMQRLVKESSEMVDIQKDLGIEVKDNDLSFANVVKAISVIQKKRGIMGTTAAEAKATISGSIGMLKAAWQNLLTSFGDKDGDVQGNINKLFDSLKIVAKNIAPVFKTVLKNVLVFAKESFKKVSGFFDNFVQNLKKSDNPVLQKVGAGIEAVSSAIQGVYNLITNWDEEVAKLKGDDNPIKIALGTALELLKSTFDTVISLINDWDSTVAAMKDSGDPFKIALGTALEGIQGLFNTIKDLVNNWDGTVAAMKDSGDPFQIALGTALETIKTLFDDVGKLIDNWDETVSKMKDSDNPIETALGEALAFIVDGFNGIILLINGDWVAAIQKFKESDSDILQTVGAIGDTFDQGRQRIQSFIDKTKEALGLSGSGGHLYESFASRMGHSFAENVTDEGSFNEWLGSLKKGLQEADVASKDIETIMNHFQRMGAEADPQGVLGSLQQLVDNPYGMEQLLATWEKLDKYYEKNPLELPEQPELSEEDLKKQNEKAQAWLDMNPLEQQVWIKMQGYDPSDNEPQGYLNGTPDFEAKGNWNVPYDNYPALLHRGEMVLNKSQARQYRDGEQASGINIDRAVERAMSKVYVMMSGEKVGDLTTKRVKNNINASSYKRLRAFGG